MVSHFSVMIVFAAGWFVHNLYFIINTPQGTSLVKVDVFIKKIGHSKLRMNL